MQIKSKLIEIETNLPVDNIYIENTIRKMGITPLRWAIVKVDCNKLHISIAYA